MANSNKRQALNVRPYSKYSTVLFIIFHLIAICCHISSFIAGLNYLPKDVLVYPLAELTSTQSEIVGPCLGESTLKNAAGAIIADPGCKSDFRDDVETIKEAAEDKRVADSQAVYPLTIGADTQPRCDGTNLQDSCGVDERHREVKFSIKIDDSKRQEFKEINIFGLFVWVDLISIIFHTYAVFMTKISRYQDVMSAISGISRGACKCFESKKSRKEEGSAAKLEDLTETQRHSAHFPRAPEYNRRWLDISLTYGILTIAVALCVGITNFFTLSFLFLSLQVIGFLGFLVDDARYQLRISDADAYNKSQLYEELQTILRNQSLTVKQQQDISRLKPLASGWTQPVRNIVLCVGLQIILWWAVTFTIQDAADNIIVQLDLGSDGLGADAFVELASVFRWLTGIIGFWMLLVIIGDVVAGDRTKSELSPPGNFLLEELDGDACFVILMFITKIVVTWIAISTITEVYNFAGGVETRNGVDSVSYLDKNLVGVDIRTLMLVTGISLLGILTLFNWFLTPSSKVYPLVGKKIENTCCPSCLTCCGICKSKDDDEDDSAGKEAEVQSLMAYKKNNSLMF